MPPRLKVGIPFRRAALLHRPSTRRFTATSSRLAAPLASPLSDAAAELRPQMLAACHNGRASGKTGAAKPTKASGSSSATTTSDYEQLVRSLGGAREGQTMPSVTPTQGRPALPDMGDWSEVRNQAEVAATWPSHPLQAQERLAFASAFVSQAAGLLGPQEKEADCGGRLCTLFEKLCKAGGLIHARESDAVYGGVVVANDEQSLGAACREAAALLLGGHAVSLASPKGQALELARQMVSGFPPALLQAVEAGPTITLPALVHSFRSIGCDASDLWAEKVPPADFGNLGSRGGPGVICHGMAAAALPFTLAQTSFRSPEDSSGPRYELREEIQALTEFMHSSSGVPSPPINGSRYDRGVRQVHDLLDLLWAFQGTEVVEGVRNPVVSLTAAHKHFILTGSSAVPEDVVKAALVAALSPLSEKVTLHVVGLGSRGLLRDPMLSFCKLVQSGRSGLEWRVKEHRDWSGFLEWLHDCAAEEPEPPQLYSTQRQLEIEVRRSCAAAGGVAWTRLFVPEPFDQLRRWTSVSETS